MKLIPITWLLIILTTLFPHFSEAQSGGYTHDRVFVSVSAGLAGGSISSKVEGEPSLTIYGTAFATDGRIGYALTEHVAMQCGFVYALQKEPKVSLNGASSGVKAEGMFVDEYMFGIGPVWHFNRYDTWLSLLAGAGYVAARNKELDKSSTSDGGLGFQFKAGKDFWVSPGMTLGIGIMYMKSYIKNNGSGEHEIINSNRFAAMVLMGFD